MQNYEGFWQPYLFLKLKGFYVQYFIIYVANHNLGDKSHYQTTGSMESMQIISHSVLSCTMRNLFSSQDVKLTKNAKWISGAKVTNLFQVCCTVPDYAIPLFFKNQNVNNKSFEMRYCESLYHVYFLKKLKISTWGLEIGWIETNLLHFHQISAWHF